MEDDRAGQSPDRAMPSGDAMGLMLDGWHEADDAFGDEAAFPSLWQELEDDGPAVRA